MKNAERVEQIKKEISAVDKQREALYWKLRKICKHPNIKDVDYRGDGG